MRSEVLLLGKSSRSQSADKPVQKPYADFPLTPHPSGRWCKRIRGTLHFFGRWGRIQNGRVIRLDNFDEEATKAVDLYQEQRDDLYAGRRPRPHDAGGLTVLKLCNQFLTYQRGMLAGGDLSAHSFSAYYQTCELLLKHLSKHRRVDNLRSDDFAALRAALAGDCSHLLIDKPLQLLLGMLLHDAHVRLRAVLISRGPSALTGWYGGGEGGASQATGAQANTGVGIRCRLTVAAVSRLQSPSGQPLRSSRPIERRPHAGTTSPEITSA